MNSRHLFRCLLLAAVLAIAPSARAHPGHYHPGVDEVDEFEKQHALNAGVLHPYSGLDHLLALLAIGCAAGLAGCSRVLVTGAFAASVLVGGVAAMEGFTMPALPAVVTVVTLVAGLSIALPRRFSNSLAACSAAVFGMWQGNAHALIIPAYPLLLPYGLGYILSSSGLLFAGIALGRQISRRASSRSACPAASV